MVNKLGAIVQSAWGLYKIGVGTIARQYDVPIVDMYLIGSGMVDFGGGIRRIVKGIRPNKLRTVETWLIGNRKHLYAAIRGARETYRNSKYYERPHL